MKATELLKELRHIIKLLKNKREEMQELIDSAMSITAPINGNVKSGGISDKVGNNTAKIVDLERQLGIKALEERKNWIIAILENLSTDSYDILYELNINNRTIAEYSALRRRTPQWGYNQEKAAIKELQKLLNKEKQ